MPESWDLSNVKDWETLVVKHLTGRELCMAMWGSNITRITEDNYEDVAKFIADKRVLTHGNSFDDYVSYDELLPVIKKYVGFRRSWS